MSPLLTLPRLSTAARVKKSPKSNQIKFKIRCSRYLYTLILKDSDKADKIKQSLPPCKFSRRFPFRLMECEGWLGQSRKAG